MPVDRNRFPFLPERIEGLADVATNLSWSWKRDARRVFQLIDDPLWHLTRHNPIAILRRVDPGRLSECARDPHFLELYDAMMAISAHTISKTELGSLLRKLTLDTQRRLAEPSGNAEE